jgi:hypothetical protein
MLPPLMPTLAALAQIIASLGLLSCSERIHGDTTFKDANRGFDGELTPEQRKATIRKLQRETAAGS